MNNESAIVSKVIAVKHTIGDGTTDNPYRTVIDIYTRDGILITRNDPINNTHSVEYVERIWTSLRSN